MEKEIVLTNGTCIWFLVIVHWTKQASDPEELPRGNEVPPLKELKQEYEAIATRLWHSKDKDSSPLKCKANGPD